MSRRLFVAAAVLGLLAPAAHAQPPDRQLLDRRDRGYPEVVPEPGGRVGTCDVLLFSPDGRFLLAGGDDKVVRVWPHTPAGLITAPAADPTDESRARVFRWPAWREQRGGGKAVALSPDGGPVATYALGPNLVADPAAAVPKPTRMFSINDGKPQVTRVFAAALTADRKAVVIACVAPRVLVQPLDGGKPVEIALPENSY